MNILERGSQVHFMAEFQELLDFPPAPKLDMFALATLSLGSADPGGGVSNGLQARAFTRCRQRRLFRRDAGDGGQSI